MTTRWPISEKTTGDDYSLDDEARYRFMGEHAAILRDRARRIDNDHDQLSQTPQEAAFELIEIAEAVLSSPDGKLPESVRVYLHESLKEILNGKDADVAMGIRATKGRQPLDDLTVSTVLAHVELGIRNGLDPVDAKAATLREVERLWVGGRTKDWLDDLLVKHKDKMPALGKLNLIELEAVADFEELRTELGIK